MTCGIYKLTFPSGNFYIGKSTDIDKRWKQHWDNFSKGKHTKNMQAEFNIYGNYTQEVIFECHEDHIDILEETFIDRMHPSLNGTKGRDRLETIAEHEDIFLSYFSMSTIGHIFELHNSKLTINELKREVAEAEESISELEEDITRLNICRSKEEVEKDTLNRIVNSQETIRFLNRTNTLLTSEVSSLSKECNELLQYKALPWYKKLFN